MDIKNVTIIIPALNEAAFIGKVIQDLVNHLPEAEIIVVDDGSSDSTATVAGKAGANVINHDHTRGYGAALRTGVEASSQDYVLFCDGDGQHTPEDVARLIETCDGFDMIVGKRNRESHVPLADGRANISLGNLPIFSQDNESLISIPV